jgi:DNA-binding Lrp family transcriptional regulator
MSTELTSIEKAMLEMIQTGFPISADPYAEIGAAVGCTREEAHATVIDLRRRGIIRRIGGSFAADKLGYISTLVAARVTPESLEMAAAVAGSFPEVTHNYERAANYNLWFTVIAENQPRMDEILDAVRQVPGVQAVHSLPALRTFKIKVDFKFKEGGAHA